MKYWLCAGALAALFGGLMLDGARKDGVTFDEVYHIPVGYVFLHGGPYFDRGHPPLMRYLYALALPRDLKLDRDDRTWGRDGTGYGARFLLGQRLPMMNLVLRARLVVIVLALALALLVAELARRRYGPRAALLALLLCAGSPDLIAHGHLATNDLGAAAAMFVAAIFLWRFAEAPSFRRALAGALAMAIAFLVKFTAMLLAPIALMMLLAHRRRKWLAPYLGLGALTFVLVMLLGVASFGFRTGSLAEDLHVTQTDKPQAMADALARVAPSLHTTPDKLMHLQVPGYLFFKNVGFLVGRSVAPEVFTSGRLYLLGEYSKRGWHSYFLVTFLLKTPLPFLALLILLAYARPRGVWPFLLPALGYYAICLSTHANIGQRHILPIYPWLIGAASVLAVDPRRWIRWSAWGLALLGLMAVLQDHPYELAYFNDLAGHDSWRRLSDSNIDWGQDLPRLAKWQRENEIGPIRADLHCSVPPGSEGVVLGPSQWTVSVTRLLSRQAGSPNDVDKWGWLRARTPDVRIGRSIFVYRNLP